MGTNPTKAADNIYCKCRKEAAKYNDKLNSREGAAELLGISASTLADYELGITKIIPADAILRMADLYNAPELRNHYCKYSCPLADWSHEEVLAYIHYYNLVMPPIYDWKNGYLCGTHPWAARQWTGSIENGWKEVYEIEPDIVKEAAKKIPSAKEFLKGLE